MKKGYVVEINTCVEGPYIAKQWFDTYEQAQGGGQTLVDQAGKGYYMVLEAVEIDGTVYRVCFNI